jgi:hypothetical protein
VFSPRKALAVALNGSAAELALYGDVLVEHRQLVAQVVSVNDLPPRSWRRLGQIVMATANADPASGQFNSSGGEEAVELGARRIK